MYREVWEAPIGQPCFLICAFSLELKCSYVQRFPCHAGYIQYLFHLHVAATIFGTGIITDSGPCGFGSTDSVAQVC